MATRPANIVYWTEERPPPPVLLALAVQHIFLMSSSLVLPVVLVTETGGSSGQVKAVLAMTMVACGLGTMLQALRWRGIGSGYLCPNLAGPNFFAASMGAVWLGGLPLMRGMTIAAGIVEIVFAKLLPRLAFLFPTEITGLVVFMVGFGMVPLAVSKILGVAYAGDPIQPEALMVGLPTLAVMVGINVWGSRRIKLYAVLIGMAVGYGLSAAMGLLGPADYHTVGNAAWIGVPDYEGLWSFSFRWSLLPAFTIVSICGALKTFGNLVLSEKANDAAWSKPDLHRIGGGLIADGITVVLSGLCGSVPSDTSASNVGLSMSSGATSRWVGFAAGALFLALGFSPKLSAVLAVMPGCVGGAILIFVLCFMLISGIQILVGAGFDTRKTFVVGLALLFGGSLDVAPELYTHVYDWMRPLFDSSLTLSVVVAVILNQVLRLRWFEPGAKGPSAEKPS